MRRRWVAGVLATALALGAAAACSSFDSSPTGARVPDAGDEAPPPAPPPPPPPPDAAPSCRPDKPFGTAVALPSPAVNTDADEDSPHLTADELTLVFKRGGDLYRAVRTDVAQPFPAAAKMGISSGLDGAPWIAPDGLELVYSSFRAFSWHLYRARRPNVASDFVGPPELIPTPPPLDPLTPLLAPSADGGRELWFVSRIDGDAASPFSIFSLPYPVDAAVDATTLTAARVDVVPGSSAEYPVLSPDGLTLFVTVRPPNDLEYDVSVAKREGLAGAFGPPAPVDELNTSGHPEHPGWISPDGCRIYFASGRLSSSDLYVASRGL